MALSGMTYRGPWKWLRAPRRKRKRMEVEEAVWSQGEDMSSEGEDQAEEEDMGEGNAGGVQGGGNAGGVQGGWNGGGGQGEVIVGGGQGGGNGGGGQGGGNGDGGQGGRNGGEVQGGGNGDGGQGGGNGGGGQGGGNGGGGQGGGNEGGGNGDGGQGGGNEGGGQGGVFLPDVPQAIIWGRRSHLDGEPWTCVCNHTNHPSRELLVDLPAFECSNCKARTRIDFRFSFGNLAANEECPIGEVLDQGETNECLTFALTKGTEITARMCEILSGSGILIPTLDPASLKEIYELFRLQQGFRSEEISFTNKAAMESMIQLMQIIGVQDVKRLHTYRIGGVERVHGYFEDIVRELARGYPLAVDIMPGKEFTNLKYGEIYRCPFNNRTVKEGSKVMMHTVLLVGAARLGDDDYFYFLNSYGEWWCVRIHRHTKHEIGGIGKLLAEDICCEPYKFLRIVQP